MERVEKMSDRTTSYSTKRVEMVDGTTLFEMLFKGCLDRLVKRCGKGGLEDTRYEDRPWWLASRNTKGRLPKRPRKP